MIQLCLMMCALHTHTFTEPTLVDCHKGSSLRQAGRLTDSLTDTVDTRQNEQTKHIYQKIPNTRICVLLSVII